MTYYENIITVDLHEDKIKEVLYDKYPLDGVGTWGHIITIKYRLAFLKFPKKLRFANEKNATDMMQTLKTNIKRYQNSNQW